jgi:ABC-type dipeptide/oligopeptide/nickel transport system ATPase component
MKLRALSRADWLREFAGVWRQGEHIALIGPTGSGKTNLASDIVNLRAYAAVFALKPHDETLHAFHGFKTIRKWPPEYGQNKVILWVKPQSLRDVFAQRDRIMRAMEQIYKAGNWCVYLDELSYMSEVLKMRMPVVVFLNQGRSSGISAVAATTRPRRVPVEMFNQISFVVAFRFNDREELRRIAQIAGIDMQSMIYLNSLLARHKQGKREWSDFLCIGKETVYIVRNDMP